MSEDRFKFKRGTTAKVAAYLPLESEPVYDKTLKKLRIGDGTTLGGVPLTLEPSPAFTGVPTSPTAAQDTSTTQIATTAFVVGQASATTPVVNGTGAVGTSLRYARADHVHPTDTSRAPTASPALTGVPTAPTAVTTTNTTQLATTAFVQQELNSQPAFVNLTLQNSWVNNSGSSSGYRTLKGLLYLEMGVISGTATNATIVATLPVGSRPPRPVRVPVLSSPAVAPSPTMAVPWVIIDTNGEIRCNNCTSAGGIFFALTVSLV